MKKNKIIPYLLSDYNKIVDVFLLEKIKSMQKDELLSHLKNQESWIYDCYLREKCINLFLKTGGFSPIGLSVDDLYRIGVDTTIKQINKRYFFDLQNDSNLLILNKMKSRIVNNKKNYFNSTRRINYLQFKNFITQINDSSEISEEIIVRIDLEKIDRETLKNGLKRVWEGAMGDVSFDIEDFNCLCAKYGFTPLDILIYDPYIMPLMSKEDCNNRNYQLVLIFEEVA